MPRYVYTGKEKNHNIACVGTVQPGEQFDVTHKQAVEIEKRASDSYRLVGESDAKAKTQNRQSESEVKSGAK